MRVYLFPPILDITLRKMIMSPRVTPRDHRGALPRRLLDLGAVIPSYRSGLCPAMSLQDAPTHRPVTNPQSPTQNPKSSRGPHSALRPRPTIAGRSPLLPTGEP